MSEDDIRTMSIDLRSFMQRHPSVVHGDARLSRAYRQFRTMGLRHMYVMPSRPRVVGLLTRKDVIQERASLTLGLYARGLARPRARTVSRTFEPPADARDADADARDAGLPEPTSRTATVEDDDAKNDLPYIPYYSNNAQDDEDAGVHTTIPPADAADASSARASPRRRRAP